MKSTANYFTSLFETKQEFPALAVVEELKKEVWRQVCVTADEKKDCVKSLLVCKDLQVEQRPLLSNKISFRKRRAREVLFTSLWFFFFSIVSLFNLKSITCQSHSRFQLQNRTCFSTIYAENSCLARGELRHHWSSAKKEVQHLASMKTLLHQKETSAFLSSDLNWNSAPIHSACCRKGEPAGPRLFIDIKDHSHSFQIWQFYSHCWSTSSRGKEC